MSTHDDRSGSQNNCSICSKLSDKEYAMQKYGWEENNTYLPDTASQLKEIKDFLPYGSRKSILKQCQECGTYYLYETDYEYLVNGTEDEEFLTRLSEEEAKKYLNVIKKPNL